MIRIVVAATLSLAACQGRGQAPNTKPAAEGPPIKPPAAKPAGETTPKPAGPGQIEVDHAVAWLKAYMLLGEALVHSQGPEAKTHAAALAAAEPPDALRQHLSGFPPDLKGQRLRFAKMSAELHAIWLADKNLQAGTVVMHCPMVPADWIQPAGKLRNPYMPETMLRCGYQVAPKP